MRAHSLEDIYPQLKLVYPGSWDAVAAQLKDTIANAAQPKILPGQLDQTDIMLITYGDSIQQKDYAPLKVLNIFYSQFASESFSAIHLLPFFPWTTDDGFSIVNYNQVDPGLGDWNHIERLAQNCDLMFDAVVNHISKSSSWFQKFISGSEEVSNHFIVADPSKNYTSVVRPRNLPLLTEFDTSQGKKHIWTTFSDDQIDLNFAEPKVLIAIIDILIEYASFGSRFIRLDAIGFIWKELGTSCMHLPETHALIQVMRKVLDIVVPGTLLITETNVPHLENLSYFGDGTNEASLIYQFPLPPLVLHTLLTGDSSVITKWANQLDAPPGESTFFNFLSSHDGIGMRPATGLLGKEDIARLQKHTHDQNGYVSFKDNGDGTQSPYELNINFFDAISDSALNDATNQRRMFAAHAILLALQGLPAVYIHSFLGSHGDKNAVKDSGIFRRINRAKLDFVRLSEQLIDPETERYAIYTRISDMAKARREEVLFSPKVAQRVLSWSKKLMVIERYTEQRRVLCVTNISNEMVSLPKPIEGFDLLSKQNLLLTAVTPYQIVWLV